MKAPVVLDVYLGCAKPTPAEVALERAIGCGRRPLFCYKIGPKWAHLLYVTTLTPVRVRAGQLQTLVVFGSEVEMRDRGLAQDLLARIRWRVEMYEHIAGVKTPAAVREAMDVLENIHVEGEA